MIGTFWHGLNAIKSGAAVQKTSRNGKPRSRILGAGMMGEASLMPRHQKALQCIKDVSFEAAEKGKAYSQKLLDKKVCSRHVKCRKT